MKSPVNNQAEETKGAAPSSSNQAKKPDNDQVPDFAKRIISSKLMKGKKKEPQIRYVYTHRPGSDGAPVKTAVIKKVT